MLERTLGREPPCFISLLIVESFESVAAGFIWRRTLGRIRLVSIISFLTIPNSLMTLHRSTMAKLSQAPLKPIGNNGIGDVSFF